MGFQDGGQILCPGTLVTSATQVLGRMGWRVQWVGSSDHGSHPPEQKLWECS